MAWLEEIQAIDMVWDGTEIGIPAPMEASLAMLLVLGSWMTEIVDVVVVIIEKNKKIMNK